MHNWRLPQKRFVSKYDFLIRNLFVHYLFVFSGWLISTIRIFFLIIISAWKRTFIHIFVSLSSYSEPRFSELISDTENVFDDIMVVSMYGLRVVASWSNRTKTLTISLLQASRIPLVYSIWSRSVIAILRSSAYILFFSLSNLTKNIHIT